MCHILINNLVSCFMVGCLSCHLEFITERKSPFYTRSVTRLKGRINWFFFLHAQKKMKEVTVVTLDEGVRGMCGEINPFRIGEQFLFQQPLCFGSHHTHISRATSCFLRLLQSYSCPFIAPKPETWLFSFQSLALSHLSMLLVLNPRSLYQKKPKRIRSINVDGKVQLCRVWQR